jgi:hypothetical protein
LRQVAEEPNYLGQAFKSQYNLIGLATALGFAVLSGTALPLIVAAGVEMMVLPLVAGSSRFQRLVRARLSQEQQEEHQAQKQVETSGMLRSLSDPERHRYRLLEGLSGEIRQNYRGLDASSRMLLDDVVRKLDFLLSFYLRMRHSLGRYDSYFATTDPERMQERIAMLDHEIATGPERVRQIKARTRAVLVKRLERYRKAHENRQLIEAQTETVQEVLQLLRDQSYSMTDPRTITEQLDGLVSAAEETERGVKDMEDILALEQDGFMPASLDEQIEAELEKGREQSAADVETPSAGARARGVPTPVRPRPAVTQPPSAPPPQRKKITH